jgi:hypothetical protein
MYGPAAALTRERPGFPPPPQILQQTNTWKMKGRKRGPALGVHIKAGKMADPDKSTGQFNAPSQAARRIKMRPTSSTNANSSLAA